jgi:antitoxin VapB
MINLSEETEVLARRLAKARHVTVEDAVKQALVAWAHVAGLLPDAAGPRDQSPEAVAAKRARMDRIVREVVAMPVLDARSPREIMDDLNGP